MLCFGFCLSAHAAEGIGYRPKLVGAPESAQSALTASLSLFTEDDRPDPWTLLRRAQADRRRAESLLSGLAYYDAQVAVTIDDLPVDSAALAARLNRLAADDAAPATLPVVVAVTPGPVYPIGALRVSGLEDTGVTRDAAGIAPGDAATGKAVRAAEAALIDALQAAGYARARLRDSRYVVDREEKHLIVTWQVAAGPQIRLGEVIVEPTDARIDRAYIQRHVTFAPGAVYSPQILQDLRRALSGTGLFSLVEVTLAPAPDPDGLTPVLVQLEPRAARSIGFGADFATDEGIGLSARWQHRNLLGSAERLTISARLARLVENSPQDVDAQLRAVFEKPDFRRLDQNLALTAEVARETPDAFERLGVSFGASVNRPVWGDKRASLGLELAAEQITEDDGTEDFFVLFGVPAWLSGGTVDDPLDPTKGLRWRLAATPYPSFLGAADPFVVTTGRASTYADLSGWFGQADGRTVLALRGRVGAILAKGLDGVPADKRFFSGGGGALRGYEFQAVAPRDDDGDLQGGRSLIETSLELRFRVAENWGVVPFVDAGTVGRNASPDFGEDLRVGAGLGLRYYTLFGPLRLDAAVPLIRRGDTGFGLYFSIGQAF